MDAKVSAAEILAYLRQMGYDATLTGDGDATISGYCELDKLKQDCMTWAVSRERAANACLDSAHGLLLVTGEELDAPKERVNQLICAHPKAAFFSAVKRFFVPARASSISPRAAIETAHIGRNVSVGAFSYICAEASIADDVTIGNNVSIECPTVIGRGSVIGSGVVIGTDGYGYYEDMNGLQQRVPHTGGVRIGEDVEIGANTCIDRGTIGDTVIEDGVKIDNLCHIAHNVHIGRSAMVIALSMLAGSSHIGERAYIAPGAMIMNQKTVGENSLVGMGAVVVGDVPEGKVVAGVPAKVLRDNK